MLGRIQVSFAVVELIGQNQHPQVGRCLIGLGERLPSLLNAAIERRLRGLFSEDQSEFFGPCDRGLRLTVALRRHRFGMGFRLLYLLNVLKRQQHGLARCVGLRELAPGVGPQVAVHLGRERLLVREEAIEHLPGLFERLAKGKHFLRAAGRDRPSGWDRRA